MLSSSDICRLIETSEDDLSRLAIIPKPNLARLKNRGGTSIDLRLGRWFKTFKQTRKSVIPLSAPNSNFKINEVAAREHFVRFGEPFTLHPGRFVLGVTLEWVRLPDNLSGQILGKSSLGRHGLIIETASGVHPNFTGCLTLELANIGEVPLQIFPGMEICQLFFYQVATSTNVHSGRLSGNRKPKLPELAEDLILSALTRDPD